MTIENRSLAFVGLVVGLLAWPAFGIFVSYSFGDLFMEDQAEQNRLMAQNQLISGLAFTIYLLCIPVASWIAGITFTISKVISSLTMLSVFGNVAIVIAFFYYG